MKKIKFTVILIACLTLLGLGTMISKQYKEYGAELVTLEKYNRLNNNIFNNEYYDVENTKLDDALKKVEGIDKELVSYNSLLPKFDTAKNFIRELKNFSNISNTKILIEKNTTFNKEFFNESLIVLTIEGDKNNVKSFGVSSELISQLHSWNDVSLVSNSEDAYKIKASVLVYSVQDEFNSPRKHIILPTSESQIWLPFISSKSNKNIGVINEIASKTEKYQREINVFYSFLSKKNISIDMALMIDLLSKNRKPFPEVL